MEFVSDTFDRCNVGIEAKTLYENVTRIETNSPLASFRETVHAHLTKWRMVAMVDLDSAWSEGA